MKVRENGKIENHKHIYFYITTPTHTLARTHKNKPTRLSINAKFLSFETIPVPRTLKDGANK